MQKVHNLNSSQKDTDYLIFDKRFRYSTALVKVDTKDYALPQTRQRCYLLVYKLHGDEDEDDDLAPYFQHLVTHLKEPVKVRSGKERSVELRGLVYGISTSVFESSVRDSAAADFAAISNAVSASFFVTRFARRSIL